MLIERGAKCAGGACWAWEVPITQSGTTPHGDELTVMVWPEEVELVLPDPPPRVEVREDHPVSAGLECLIRELFYRLGVHDMSELPPLDDEELEEADGWLVTGIEGMGAVQEGTT